MNIGVYCSPNVLAHKLERRHLPGKIEEVWNCSRTPKGMGLSPAPDRLVIACNGRWVGYFHLVPEVLIGDNDSAHACTLIFDAKSWTPLRNTLPRKPFRGWTYKVPEELFRLPADTPTDASA